MFDLSFVFQTAKLAQVEEEIRQIDEDIESLQTNGKEMLIILLVTINCLHQRNLMQESVMTAIFLSHIKVSYWTYRY